MDSPSHIIIALACNSTSIKPAAEKSLGNPESTSNCKLEPRIVCESVCAYTLPQSVCIGENENYPKHVEWRANVHVYRTLREPFPRATTG